MATVANRDSHVKTELTHYERDVKTALWSVELERAALQQQLTRFRDARSDLRNARTRLQEYLLDLEAQERAA